jgi:XTP/dITP diphosphohydrolase
VSQIVKKIVIASHNAGKVREIDDLFKRTNVQTISLKTFNINEPRETGSTFIENSILKSRNASIKTNFPAIADDSGLCVSIINNEPGIYSARWAGRTKDYKLAMNKIEKKIQTISDMKKKDRKAFFVCALSLYFPDHTYKVFEGKIHGHLQFPPKGANGFGYDPIFVPVGFSKTFGEMKYNFKEKISHRAKAFQKLMQYLKKI